MDNSSKVTKLDATVAAVIIFGFACIVVMVVCSWAPSPLMRFVDNAVFAVFGWSVSLFYLFNTDRVRRFAVALREKYPTVFTSGLSDSNGYWRVIGWMAFFLMLVAAFRTFVLLAEAYVALR